MTRLALLALPIGLLLAGCGDPGRRSCTTSATCPAGQFCDHSVGEGLCWPDATPPVVSGVTAACTPSPCERDGVLAVEADAADGAELGVLQARVELSGATRTVTGATQVGPGRFRVEVPLADLPLPGAQGTAVATFIAADAARNTASAAVSGVVVTRVRAGITLENGALPSAPAVTENGTVVVGVGAKLYFVPPGAGTPVSGAASLVGAIQQPPSIAGNTVWVAAGTRVYALNADGSAVLNGAGYDTLGTVVGPPALSSGLTPGIAFAASVSGRMFAVKASATNDGLVNFSQAFDPFTSGPILAGDGVAWGVTATAEPVATLRKFTYDGALGPGVTRNVGAGLSAPLALAGDGSVWTSTTDVGKALSVTSAGGLAGTAIAVNSSGGSGAAILAGGDVAFCDGATLRRHGPDGTARWTTPAPLDGVGLTPMALTGGPVALLVPTRAGAVHAFDAGGHELWRVTLAAGTELREGNLFHAPGAPTSTAWFTSAGGTLHGLVIDGRLDPAAPWPKAWHDPRNTGNAATPLPP